MRTQRSGPDSADRELLVCRCRDEVVARATLKKVRQARNRLVKQLHTRGYVDGWRPEQTVGTFVVTPYDKYYIRLGT